MKYRILAVIAVLVFVFNLSVAAEGYEYNISVNSNFTVAKSNDDLTAVAEKLNMTTDELNSYFNQNGIIYLAISNDGKTQIRLSEFTDNFSSAVGDISLLDKDALDEFVNAVSDDGDNAADIITTGDRKYIRTKSTLKDSGGTYTVTQYVTICNNKTFYFSGYNEGDDTSDVIKSAFESFSIDETTSSTPNLKLYNALIIVGIALFSTISVIMIIGIIKAKKIKRKALDIAQ